MTSYSYYVKWDKEIGLKIDNNFLCCGEESFGIFFSDSGMVFLDKLSLIKNEDYISRFYILRNDGKKYSVQEFFDHLLTLKIKRENVSE